MTQPIRSPASQAATRSLASLIKRDLFAILGRLHHGALTDKLSGPHLVSSSGDGWTSSPSNVTLTGKASIATRSPATRPSRSPQTRMGTTIASRTQAVSTTIPPTAIDQYSVKPVQTDFVSPHACTPESGSAWASTRPQPWVRGCCDAPYMELAQHRFRWRRRSRLAWGAACGCRRRYSRGGRRTWVFGSITSHDLRKALLVADSEPLSTVNRQKLESRPGVTTEELPRRGLSIFLEVMRNC